MTTDCDFVGLLLDVKKNTTGRAAQPRNWLPGEAVEFCIFGGIQDSVKQSRTWPFLVLMTALLWAGVWLSEVPHNYHCHDSMITTKKHTIKLTPSLVDWLRFQLPALYLCGCVATRAVVPTFKNLSTSFCSSSYSLLFLHSKVTVAHFYLKKQAVLSRRHIVHTVRHYSQSSNTVYERK